jgi:hypothetical protein
MKPSFTKPWTVLLTLLALLLSTIGVSPAYAATFSVTNLNDSGAGSLRQAITNANANAGVTDTITFGVSGTITLLSELPAISDPAGLTIDGAGQTVTVSGNNTVRVISVDSGAALAIKNLTIAHGFGGGSDGGGIYSLGMLNIANSTFSNNSVTTSGTFGGGVYSGGNLNVTNSSFLLNSASGSDGSGGGIYIAVGGAIIKNSSFTSNSATGSLGVGGGIGLYPGTTLNVMKSTFIINTAVLGGGIGIGGSTTTIAGSTFSANSASNSGGAIYNFGALTITNSSMIGNSAGSYGGAIDQEGGLLTVTNSDFSNNTAHASATAGAAIYNSGTATLGNTILAKSNVAGSCGGALITNGGHNIDDGNSCGWGSLSGSMSNTNPLLGSSTGSPSYFPLTIGSPALDAGNDALCSNPSVNNESQNGISRPQGVHCDIGSFELDYAPMLDSIVRANPDPTAAASVNFTVTFSEPVTGVDAADFSLTTTGIAGASVTTVSGGPMAYNVTVSTGSGNGTLRLDVPVTATATDLSANSLADLPYIGGETYTINKTLTFVSSAAQDGWMLESSELSNKGGSINKVSKTFNLGDDAARRQYRGILSFSTGAALPDTAGITGVTLLIKKSAIVGGGDPLTIFKGFIIDIKNGTFGTAALQIGDFQAKASQTVGPFKVTPVGNWYSIDLTAAAASINKLASSGGLTQIRLRFKLDDNNNSIANYLSLFSGNAPAANRPQLIIQYYLPNPTD